MRPDLHRRARAVSRLLAATIAAAFLAAGCGGDGSSGGPTEPQPPAAGIVFTADRIAGSNAVVLRSGADTTATRLELEVFASNLVNVLTMDFTIVFPGNLLQFDGVRAGDFLGASTSTIVQQAGAGAVTLLMTRTGQGGATGSGVAVTLDFRALASGNGRIDFVDPEAADPFGLEIPGIDWIGGTVRVDL